MNDMLIAGTPVTLGDLVLMVGAQQDQISGREEEVAALAAQIAAAGSGAGGTG